ncbi:expressed unknown protein [Seminavis robusta]|uniref:Uncharacterized protein n=1 Tax=Seminavis robusta TaxID=568900 RepID=A0A9N8E113_9STRA|nr:expressed unknown protein [Seminavis robusta]|eukprot:Sro453_g146080.1 n/a (157) ;mRNA; r:23128-23598
MTTTTIPATYLEAHRALCVIVCLVTAYGSAMTLAGRSAALPLFDGLGFGPNSNGLNKDAVDYCIFMFGVLGAVIVGWMVLMWFVLRHLAVHPDVTVRITARRAVTYSAAAWFFLDTGFSIAMGELEHAAFNIPFLSGLAIPLYVMSTSEVHTKKGQ